LSFFSFELDPHHVLGVSGQATLEEIRSAYREKAKRYHPDAGGEDWTFRILSQAYEMLSTARVARATHREPEPSKPQAHPRAQRAKPERKTESVHAGIFDHETPRARVVAIELLCIRYLWDDADFLWLTQRVPDEDRFLSCSLNVSWPDQDAALRPMSHDEGVQVLTALQDAFDQMIINTRAVSSRSRAEDEQFGGWLAYSNFDRAFKALGVMHDLLRSRGLGMRQWSRDLFIPRSRR
jgi:DnaJ domain